MMSGGFTDERLFSTDQATDRLTEQATSRPCSVDQSTARLRLRCYGCPGVPYSHHNGTPREKRSGLGPLLSSAENFSEPSTTPPSACCRCCGCYYASTVPIAAVVGVLVLFHRRSAIFSAAATQRPVKRVGTVRPVILHSFRHQSVRDGGDGGETGAVAAGKGIGSETIFKPRGENKM